MFVVNNYATAVILCIVTMLCWGSWGNTQKLAGRTWRYELFYWDYVDRHAALFADPPGLHAGQHRERRAVPSSKISRRLNARGPRQRTCSAASSSTPRTSCFPPPCRWPDWPSPFRWAWVWRWCWAWSSITLGAPKGDPVILFLGVVLIVIAIVCNGIASGRVRKEPAIPRRKTAKAFMLAVRGRRPDVVLLPLRGRGDGPRQLRGPDARHADALFGDLHLLGGRSAEQLRLQHATS